MAKKEPIEIIHYDDMHTFRVMKGDEVELCYLSLYEDTRNEDDFGPKYWLNSLDIDADYRNKGYAEQLIEMAIDYYGRIYVSTASAGEHEEKEGSEKTNRALDDDKRLIVDALVAEGVIKKSWLRNPFEPMDDDVI